MENPVHRAATPRDTFQELLNEGWEQYAEAQQLGASHNRVAAVYAAVHAWVKTYSLRGAVETAYLPFVQTIRIEDDSYAWLREQARFLRNGRFDLVHPDAIAEELEDMALSTERALEHDLEQLLSHLLKLQYEPSDNERRMRARGWKLTVAEHRNRVSDILARSTVLQNRFAQFKAKAYLRARKLAGLVMEGLPNWNSIFPPNCPWSDHQILDDDNFFAEPETPALDK